MRDNLKKLQYIDITYPSGAVSIKEKIGYPDEFGFAIGRVVTHFAYLEDILKMMIRFLLKLDSKPADIVMSELSFKNLTNIFASLIKNSFAEGLDNKVTEELSEIIYLIGLSEEYRNTVIHSSYAYNRHRIKKTAKKEGLKITSEVISADYIFDVADFMIEVADVLTNVPFLLGLADKSTNDGVYFEYTFQDNKIFEHNLYHGVNFTGTFDSKIFDPNFFDTDAPK